MNSDTIKQTIENTNWHDEIAYFLYRLYFIDRWWDWCNEYYVGFRDRANQRNWCENGYWGKTI